MGKITDWLHRLTAKVNDTQPIPVPLEELPVSEQCRRIYTEHTFDEYRNYRITNGQGRAVNVVYKTIDDYISEINHHIHIIENTGHVLASKCDFEPRVTPLNQFFLTNTGHYQKELTNTLKMLRIAVLELCNAIDKATSGEYSTTAYNLRLTNTLFNSLRDIGLTLHEVSMDLIN